MSADNGVYILETVRLTRKGFQPEFRVSHLSAIDNIEWDEKINDYTNDDDVRIVNAREMFDVTKVFEDKKEAESYAVALHEDLGWTEYGICYITINREF